MDTFTDNLTTLTGGRIYSSGGYAAAALITGNDISGGALASIVGSTALVHVIGGRYLYWDIVQQAPSIQPYLGSIMTGAGALFGKMVYDMLQG